MPTKLMGQKIDNAGKPLTSVAKVTNPKPRLLLVMRSMMTTESMTSPYCWKNSRNSRSETDTGMDAKDLRRRCEQMHQEHAKIP